MAATFHLEVVAADRTVWSGDATMIITRTTLGEIGVLANHAPVLGVLAPGTVEIRPSEGRTTFAAVDGGFLSVANNRVSILAGHAELAEEIDPAEARRVLEEAEAAVDDTERSRQALAAARARVTAVERAS